MDPEISEELVSDKHREKMLQAELNYRNGAKTYTEEEILASLDDKFFKNLDVKEDD